MLGNFISHLVKTGCHTFRLLTTPNDCQRSTHDSQDQRLNVLSSTKYKPSVTSCLFSKYSFWKRNPRPVAYKLIIECYHFMTIIHATKPIEIIVKHDNIAIGISRVREKAPKLIIGPYKSIEYLFLVRAMWPSRGDDLFSQNKQSGGKPPAFSSLYQIVTHFCGFFLCPFLLN